MIKPQIVNKLKSINELSILTHIAGQEDWVNTTTTRTHLMNLYQIADITIKKNIKSLLVKGFINKIAKGVYTINKDIIQ